MELRLNKYKENKNFNYKKNLKSKNHKLTRRNRPSKRNRLSRRKRLSRTNRLSRINRLNRKNKYSKKGLRMKGGTVQFDKHPISPLLNRNPLLNKLGAPTIRLNNYICFKQSSLNDVSNIVGEVFNRNSINNNVMNDIKNKVAMDRDLDMNSREYLDLHEKLIRNSLSF